MRLPSHQRTHASRAAVLRAALAAVAVLLAFVPASDAATRARGDVFVAKGVGRQIFAGGGGVAYGTIFSGASIVVLDYSPNHDMKIDTPVVPTINVDGSRSFVPAGGAIKTAFKLTGTLYRVTISGAATFNASGVYGRLQLRGKGTLSVNGRKDRWNGPALKLAVVPKASRPLYQLAVAGTPPPAPPVPPTTTPTTTTATTTVPASG